MIYYTIRLVNTSTELVSTIEVTPQVMDVLYILYNNCLSYKSYVEIEVQLYRVDRIIEFKERLFDVPGLIEPDYPFKAERLLALDRVITRKNAIIDYTNYKVYNQRLKELFYE